MTKSPEYKIDQRVKIHSKSTPKAKRKDEMRTLFLRIIELYELGDMKLENYQSLLFINDAIQSQKSVNDSHWEPSPDEVREEAEKIRGERKACPLCSDLTIRGLKVCQECDQKACYKCVKEGICKNCKLLPR